jgi:hypothetical protein
LVELGFELHALLLEPYLQTFSSSHHLSFYFSF